MPVPEALRTDLSTASRADLASRLAGAYQNFSSTAQAVIKQYVERGLTVRDLANDLQEAGWTGSLKRLQNIQSEMRSAGLLPPAKQGRRTDLEVPTTGTSAKGFGPPKEETSQRRGSKDYEAALERADECMRQALAANEQLVHRMLSPDCTDERAAGLLETMEKYTLKSFLDLGDGDDRPATPSELYGFSTAMVLMNTLAAAVGMARSRLR